jgi:CBS domain-containing protein
MFMDTQLFHDTLAAQRVSDWMTRDPVTCGPHTTLPEAHALMRERKVRRLPVVEDGRLLGIITLGDVREAEPSGATTLSVYELTYRLAKIPVEKLMTRAVISVTPFNSIREAAGIMLMHKVGGLPVLDDGRLVGIITESDIFRMIVRLPGD